MLLYWIWFAQLKKLTCGQKKWLLQHFRDPEELYHSDADAFAKAEGMTGDMVKALEDKSLDEARRILADCEAKGIRILTMGDSQYPTKLKNTYDPPVLLYYRGVLPQWESQPVIGVVGTRKASSYGMRAAKRYGGQIAVCGGLVLSGGAAGIDTMALEGAMAEGKPVACVFGCGVDVSYPVKNRHLFEEIAAKGCLLSEYPPKTEPNGWHFPQRNRILSGLSNGVLVVEAPVKSGALITARLAMEQGRDVYVVPGNVDETACAGSNALLQDYGIAVLSGWDVVKEYEAAYPDAVAKREISQKAVLQQEPLLPKPAVRWESDKKSVDKEEKSTYSVVRHSAADLSDQEQAVYQRIGDAPILMDQIVASTGLPAGTVKGILTRLAIKGYTVNHPGGRISRK